MVARPPGGPPTEFVLAGDTAHHITGVLRDATNVVVEYLNAAHRTVQWYDGIAGSVTAITDREIDAAGIIQAQWHRSPISPSATMTRAEWFESRRVLAPWPAIAGATFAIADPSVLGGEYDALLEVWFSFAHENRFQRDAFGAIVMNGRRRMSYAGLVQINKILYLVNPALFPIYDRVLEAGYRPLQVASRRQVIRARSNANVHGDNFSWEPFRADLIVNQEAGVFTAIREGLLLHPTQLATEAGSPVALAGFDNLNSWVSEKVTDLRLMDILAWWCFQHP